VPNKKQQLAANTKDALVHILDLAIDRECKRMPAAHVGDEFADWVCHVNSLAFWREHVIKYVDQFDD
jgi:hypothetical protein